MRIRKALVTGALAIGVTMLALGGATPASAETPVSMSADHIVDSAGVLGNSKAAVESAITTLADRDQVNLFVAYVHTFESPADAQSWATETARQNGLGARDYLLAVSVDGRAYYFLGNSAGPVSEPQLTSIEQNLIEPRLRANDWPGAARAAAAGLGDAVSGAGGGSSSNGGTTTSGGTARGTGWGAMAGGIIVVLAIVGLVLFARARRRSAVRAGGSGPGGSGPGASGPGAAGPAKPVDELQTMPLPDLERRASAALVQTDDALQASTQEVGFAEAEYGEDAARPFLEAVEAARAKLVQAFALKQKLDDDVPDTEQERRQWNSDILRLATEASGLLTEQEEAFAGLRAIEKDIPGKVKGLRSGVATSRERLSRSQATLDSLSTDYAGAALATVHDNPAQA
ncbi:MAG TPA: TPM domain-containing protein, partial [Leifsonia sp.]